MLLVTISIKLNYIYNNIGKVNVKSANLKRRGDDHVGIFLETISLKCYGSLVLCK